MSEDQPRTMTAFGAPQIWVERPHRFTLYVGPHNPKQIPVEFVAANEADIRQAARRLKMLDDQQTPQEPADVVSKFLPPDTPPTLRQDVLGALETLLEAARTFSAQTGRRDANELMQAAIKAGGLVRSAHGAKVEECLCHETTYGRHCPIHGKHWAVKEAESWEPEHGMKLVSYERKTEGTLLRVDPVPGSSIKWHVLVETNPPIVYPFSSGADLKLSWAPKSVDDVSE
jgi:hypothetical protein